VRADPFKPKLKPPGTKRVKLHHDMLLSTSAFTKSTCAATAWGADKLLVFGGTGASFRCFNSLHVLVGPSLFAHSVPVYQAKEEDAASMYRQTGNL